MPPNEPAESMVPAKNARFSGRFDEVHVRELVARFGLAPLERLGDDADVLGLVVAQPPVAFEHAVHEALHHLRMRLGEALVHGEHVGDDEQVAVRHQHLGGALATSRSTSSVFGVQPTQPFSAAAAARRARAGRRRRRRTRLRRTPGRASLRRGLRIEIAQHDHGHAGFLREVADEELALVELRGGEHLALELVDRGDAAIDDDHVGAARVADLHRHDRVELAAEHRERIGRGGRGGELAVVERTTRSRSRSSRS